MSKVICGLYGVTVDGAEDLIEDVEQALIGGAKVIQYRDKSNLTAQRFTDALALRQLCADYSACFIVNDDLDLALAVDADGLHIGKDAGKVADIRRQLRDKLLGISCYNKLENAQEAALAGADYVAFGRFFSSKTKPDAVPAELQIIQQAKSYLDLPVVAIGGITTENAKLLISAGVDAVAVIDGLFNQADIQQTAEKFVQLF